MTTYATRDHVFLLGLGSEAFVRRARPVVAADVDGPTGTIRLEAHGLLNLDEVTFEKTAGGTLPTAISEFVVYFPIRVSENLFKVSATPNGAPLTFASVGSGWSIKVDQGRRLDAHLKEASAWIDQHMTAHAPPLLPDSATFGDDLFPPLIVGLCARRAARRAVTTMQFENDQYKFVVDRLDKAEAEDKELLDAMAADGWPINPRPTDQTNIADNGARARAARAPVGWSTGRLGG